MRASIPCIALALLVDASTVPPTVDRAARLRALRTHPAALAEARAVEARAVRAAPAVRACELATVETSEAFVTMAPEVLAAAVG